MNAQHAQTPLTDIVRAFTWHQTHVNVATATLADTERQLQELTAALESLADECERHASHAISDPRPYFQSMAARARAALAKVQP